MKWYALFVRYHHERAIWTRLMNKGFEAYLPLLEVKRQTAKGGHLLQIPLIPRYVFVRCYLDMYMHLELITMPGILRLVEDTEGRPLVVPEEEILLLQNLVSAANAKNITLEVIPYAMLGGEVQVSEGLLLHGVEGFFKESGALIVTMRSLKISIAVEPNLPMKAKPALV